MRTSSKNSKRCSMLKRTFLRSVLSVFLALAPITSPTTSAWAVAITADDAQGQAILNALKSDLSKRQQLSFRAVLKNWETRYGVRAVGPLLEIANDPHHEDPDRYLAIMGAAKLGGTEVATGLLNLLKDRSWMIRAGTLRALTALNHPKTSAAVLPLLRDPALIVRSEAVDAVGRLKPIGAVDALLATLDQSENYHGGKAQWVPTKALSALVSLNAKDAAPRLRPLLLHTQDPALQEQTVSALESLTGKKLKAGAPLLAKVEQWKTELTSAK